MKGLAFAVLVTSMLVPCWALAAETTVISGVVTTRSDGLRVPNAAIAIAALNLSTTTDPSGRYTLTVPADKSSGTVEIRVTAPGLRSTTTSTSLIGGTLSVDFGLTVGFHEEVVVGSRASGVEAAKAVPVDILTARQIEATGAAEVMQILQALAPSFNFPRPDDLGRHRLGPAGDAARAGSPVARVLGSEDLQPEQSVHLNGGFVWSPVDAFELSADYYHIDIDDRIVLSGNFTGGRLATLLSPFGVGSARYFTNAIDTTTKGVDLIASYRTDLANAGNLRLQAAYNHTETRIDRLTPTPPVLAGFESVLFDAIEQRRFTCSQPEDNLRLSADWTRKSWGALARVGRYGDYCGIEAFAANVPAQVHGAEWVTDLDASYRRDKVVIAAGVENLFNTLPDANLAAISNRNQRTFPRNAPFGFNGRFLYAKLTYRF